jgi:hypothetical protein
MANITLQVLFKKYIDSLKSNKEFRNELNKEATHYFTQDVEALKSQINLINQKVEREFDKKYEQALSTLQREGMSNVTFTRISKTLKEKFLDHFTDVKELGIDAGHVYSNLTIASKQKAQTEAFEGFTGQVSEYSQVQLTPKNLQEISKTIALIAAYTGALEELDKIQDRKSLLDFLKKAPSFRQYARGVQLNTLEDINTAIVSAYELKGTKVKGLAELTNQIFRSTVVKLETDTVLNFSRKITASETGVAVTFEVRAVNQFKGRIAQGIKTAFLNILENAILKEEFSEVIDEALTNAVSEEFTKEQFLRIFTKASGSKTPEQAIVDILVETFKTGKAKSYKAVSRNLADKIKNVVSIKPPNIKLKKPVVKNRPVKSKISVEQTLTSLQNLLNTLLHEQIRQNMGTGNRRDVLNYRSGRFAQSAQVERISQGREGMITAYYTYMKYPYATFSEGGRQQFPRSRDPKLLISKSIREIMQQQMITRMRAQLI